MVVGICQTEIHEHHCSLETIYFVQLVQMWGPYRHLVKVIMMLLLSTQWKNTVFFNICCTGLVIRWRWRWRAIQTIQLFMQNTEECACSQLDRMCKKMCEGGGVYLFVSAVSFSRKCWIELEVKLDCDLFLDTILIPYGGHKDDTH